MIDSTISLAIIVSVCALISAPITAYINNRHQLNLSDDLSAGRSPSEDLIPAICRSLNRELTELSATK